MKKILIIDDEKDIIELAKAMLKGLNFEVIGATSGKEGIQKAISEKPDFIFLDVMMPGMDGWETLRTLKMNSDVSDIPVAMLTVKPLSSALRLKEIDDVVDYVTKPFSKEDLFETLRQIESLAPS